MPCPVSCTDIKKVSLSPSRFVTLSVSLTKPSCVNLIALFMILIITWRSLSESPYSLLGSDLSISYKSSTPFSPIRFRKIIDRSFNIDIGSYSSFTISSFPDSIFEKSRISLIMVSSALPEFFMFARYPFCCGLISLRKRISVIPTIAFIGVRISCDMFDIKADFAWFASSAFAFAPFSSSTSSWVCVTSIKSRQ